MGSVANCLMVTQISWDPGAPDSGTMCMALRGSDYDSAMFEWTKQAGRVMELILAMPT